MRCDIIIPVYNALDALRECLDSVIKNTDLTENGLIIINDCSPDERILPFLKEFGEKVSELNVTVLDNPKNLGFVGTVNRGMKLSQNDVLLLNSDTVVGKNWLDKIKKCAYSKEKVATVTPLSNNATLVSVPKGLQRNEVPEDITIDEYNEILERSTYRDYPELPTAHGFCVYIRREALDVVGYFDEESFGRGYCEENDFSFRCMDYGFRNLLCDDTIVYHKESMSFSGEREKVLQAHEAILKNRYPIYHNNIAIWCQRFPIADICKNLDYNLKLGKRKNILVLIHDWETNTGGTTLHLKDMISQLKDKYNFHVLFPNDDSYVIHSCFTEGEQRIYLPYRVYKTSEFGRYNGIYADMFKEVVKALRIDTIHIHHMIGHYFDVADVANELKINSVITLHDFYCLCPTINMLFCKEKYCMGLKDRDCALCLRDGGYTKNNIIDEWQKDWKTFLSKLNKIIVPSEDTKQRILQVYDGLDITAIEHGVEIECNNYIPKPQGKLNVAFIGVICNHKGGNLIKQMIAKSHNRDIMFHVFGKSEIGELEKNRDNYIFHGPYKREDLKSILQKNKIDIICFLQIWPETYSYTLNEAVSAGIPVLSLDIGAGAERVKKYGLGWTLEADSDYLAVLNKLDEIKNSPEDYNNVLKCLSQYHIKNVSEMTDEYIPVYEADIGRSTEIDYESLKALIKRERKAEISSYQIRLNEILNSAKWRVVNKIRVPRAFAGVMKKILKKILHFARRR